MVEIKNDILPAQVNFAPETPGIDSASVSPDITEVNITSSQPEVILFQADITPLPVFNEPVTSAENPSPVDYESLSVPLDSLQETNSTLSGDVPVFVETLSVEMAKKGGNPHNVDALKERARIKKLKKEQGTPAGAKFPKIKRTGK